MSKQKRSYLSKILSVISGRYLTDEGRQTSGVDADVSTAENHSHDSGCRSTNSPGRNKRGAKFNGTPTRNPPIFRRCSGCSDSSPRHEGVVRAGIKDQPRSSKCDEEVELTEEQKEELKQAFSMFEKAGKGRIPARDLGELLRCLGWNPSEQDLEEARHELELTTRSTLSYAEIESYISKRGGMYYANNAEEDIMVAFQVLDKTGSGRITVSDFRHFLTTMGERMSLEEAEELIGRTIQDGKDYIEYRDLVLAVQHLPT